jgi:3-oxoacyl-(acyl-carrier-protein) synthase
MAAAGQALDDADWHPKSDADQEASGVLIGSGIGGIGTLGLHPQIGIEGAVGAVAEGQRAGDPAREVVGLERGENGPSGQKRPLGT